MSIEEQAQQILSKVQEQSEELWELLCKAETQEEEEAVQRTYEMIRFYFAR
jgi:hypothetical protein